MGDNRIEDLYPLAGLTRLVTLRADRNRIANLWPLASLAELEALDLTQTVCATSMRWRSWDN